MIAQRTLSVGAALFLFLGTGSSVLAGAPKSNLIKKIIAAARTRLGDQYSAEYFSSGRPPKGRSACVDVLIEACRVAGFDPQKDIQMTAATTHYPWMRDSAIDHRWAPNLIVWFQLRQQSLPIGAKYKPGDIVFWNLTGDGVADHCGVLGDQKGSSGKWKVIHQFPPRCTEEDCLGRWRVVGHFRLRPKAKQ